MPLVNNVRDLFAQGKSERQITRMLHISRPTVHKYVTMDDFTVPLPVMEPRGSKLDRYKAEIDRMLEENKDAWRKQQYTATTVWRVLVKEHPQLENSYLLVQRYIRERKAIEGFCTYQELVWHPGEAQADFGEFYAQVDGKRRRLYYFVLTFPYSNHGYYQITEGVNCECVCESLKNIFCHMGCLPFVIVFDNATGIGRLVEHELRENELFARFRAHYGFRVRFCNPQAGHEKGSVEAKIGFVRRNLFVPEPGIDEPLWEYNRKQFARADSLDDHRVHYRKEKPIMDLFNEDRKAMLPPPANPFEVIRYASYRTDGYGKVCIGKKHRYSAGTDYAHRRMLVGFTVRKVIIQDPVDGKEIKSYENYGESQTDAIDYSTMLQFAYRCPGSWQNSQARECVPDGNLKDYIDGLSKHDRKVQIGILRELTESYGLDTGWAAMQAVFRNGSVDRANALSMAARLDTLDPDSSENATGVDLSKYGAFTLFGKGV